MITIKNYIKAKTLEEAYQLNQKKRNCVIGGMLWLKTGKRAVDTAIDLSGLGLDAIEETDACFRIGTMVTLRQLETSSSLNAFFGNSIRKAVADIVGVQFRNLATVGGSIWGRYGFSDVLTVFLSLETCVELYRGGTVSLEEFVRMPKDRDILTHITVKKVPGFYSYEAFRIQRTDFPVITCAVSGFNGEYRAAVGARPGRALIVRDAEHILERGLTEDSIRQFASYVAGRTGTGTNMRGGKEYRRQLIKALTERCLAESGEST